MLKTNTGTEPSFASVIEGFQTLAELIIYLASIQPKKWLTEGEIVKYYDVTATVLASWVKEKKVETQRNGTRYKYLERDVIQCKCYLPGRIRKRRGIGGATSGGPSYKP